MEKCVSFTPAFGRLSGRLSGLAFGRLGCNGPGQALRLASHCAAARSRVGPRPIGTQGRAAVSTTAPGQANDVYFPTPWIRIPIGWPTWLMHASRRKYSKSEPPPQQKMSHLASRSNNEQPLPPKCKVGGRPHILARRSRNKKRMLEYRTTPEKKKCRT